MTEAELEKENKNLSNKIMELQSSTEELQGKFSSIEQNDSPTKENLEISLKKALDEKNRTINMLSDTQEKYDTLTRQSKNIQKIVKEVAKDQASDV